MVSTLLIKWRVPLLLNRPVYGSNVWFSAFCSSSDFIIPSKYCHSVGVNVPFILAVFNRKKRHSTKCNSSHGLDVSATNYVAKSYIENVDRDTYFQDVKLQMDAKVWGEEYDRHNPPKKVWVKSSLKTGKAAGPDEILDILSTVGEWQAWDVVICEYYLSPKVWRPY